MCDKYWESKLLWTNNGKLLIAFLYPLPLLNYLHHWQGRERNSSSKSLMIYTYERYWETFQHLRGHRMVPPLVPNTGQHWPDLATQNPARFWHSALQQDIVRWYFSPEIQIWPSQCLNMTKKWFFFYKKKGAFANLILTRRSHQHFPRELHVGAKQSGWQGVALRQVEAVSNLESDVIR